MHLEEKERVQAEVLAHKQAEMEAKADAFRKERPV